MTPSTDRLRQRIDHYIASNQAVPARAALESLLARDPGDTAAHLMLGGLYAAQGRLRDATGQTLLAAGNPPADAGLLGDLIGVLIKVGEIVEARRLLSLPVIVGSGSVQVLMRAASQWQMAGDHETALALLEKAGAAGANDRIFHFCYATQLAFNGNKAAAAAEFHKCIALDPPLGNAYLQLAHLRTQTADDNHLAAIETALARVEAGSEDCAALEFAHYKELEDLHRHEEAWQSLVRGNALMRARVAHDAAREAALFGRLIKICTPAFLRASAVPMDEGPQPIFVIGMPRSGTTVLERIIGNHPRVASAGELGDFPRALAYAADHRARVMLDDLTLDRLDGVDWGEVGRTYLAQTRWRARGKSFFVDKLPRNWMLAGMIHKALPKARILHLVRDPMDVCFSNWRACLGSGPEFAYAYDLDALASHYRQYRRVMAHWRAAMPGAVLDVDYARLVHDPETVAREVMDYCGLDFEPDCVDLARNSSPCATLSVAQVREAIHARAFKAWQPYAPRLAALRDALETPAMAR